MKPHQYDNNDDANKEQTTRRTESDIWTYALFTEWLPPAPPPTPPHPHPYTPHPRSKRILMLVPIFAKKGIFSMMKGANSRTKKRDRLSDTSPSNLEKK